MKVEEIDALLGGEAQRLADQYKSVPLDFMDGYGWTLTRICRMFADAEPVIRCKDCIHRKHIKAINAYECVISGNKVNEDDYCSWAERKEE